MRTSLRWSIVLAITGSTLLLSSGRAHAQTQGLRSTPWQMPDVYGYHKLGAELMLGRMRTAPATDEFTMFAFELFGAYKVSDRLYLHGRLPVGYADDLGTALGNFTLGLEHRLNSSFGRGNLQSWSLGGSVSLPTASDSGDSGAAALLHGIYRVPYPGHYFPSTTTLRFHGQFRLDAQKVFFQAQAGLNMLLIDGADDDMLLRFGLGLGVALGRSATAIFELTTMSDILDDSDGDNFVHSLDLGVRFRAGANTRIGVRVYLPLGGYASDLDIFGLGVDVTTML